ncbi:hypothetical protein Q7P37_010772 [Cladosporium fusiforme]
MCNSRVKDLLPLLPKCEHHIHLEGALTPDLLFSLAKKNNISLPAGDDKAFASPASLTERYRSFANLDDFLHYYYIGMSVLISADDFEALAMDYFQHAAKDGVWHADVFFDPQAHLSRGVSYETVLAGFSAARDRAARELGVTSELICCFLRHLPVQDSEQTFELEALQQSFRSGAVKGIGLDSSEDGFPPEPFEQIYRKAAALGLRLTAHAGEEAPPTYIRGALDILNVERIDHGRRLPEDPDLLARIVHEGKMLTLCPLSNVFLQGVSAVSELPIPQFLKAGVKFSINSDDPAYFGDNYILSNYLAVHEAFDLSVEAWETVCRNSIHGSWCSEQRKEEILAKLGEVLESWKRE